MDKKKLDLWNVVEQLTEEQMNESVGGRSCGFCGCWGPSSSSANSRANKKAKKYSVMSCCS